MTCDMNIKLQLAIFKKQKIIDYEKDTENNLSMCFFAVFSLSAENLTQYVNPMIGTDGYGNVYPGAQIPFGGIQISPDTDAKFYDAAAGYKYNHTSILGFSLTHLSGTGIPDLGDFLFIRYRRDEA